MISGLMFPKNFTQVFASCSQDEIRLWSPANQKELLRIELSQGSHQDFTKSNCVQFMADGKSLISGWTDGKIRAFMPQSGKLFWIINNAHQEGTKDFGGVLCLTSTTAGDYVLSGGSDGEVRLWAIGKQVKKLQSAQKVHKGPITGVALVDAQNESRCASCSLDGSIIIWALRKFQILEKIKYVSIPVSIQADESQ